MPIKVFVDTEFTDFFEPQLISIGCVSETGETFYAEVPFDIKKCSDFVRQTVLPMLGYASNAILEEDGAASQLAEWLSALRHHDEKIDICYDFQTDWDLFCNLLGEKLPEWCKRRLINDRINEVRRLDFYKRNRLPEHHALNDARANFYAFED
jgi:hypothetical protein